MIDNLVPLFKKNSNNLKIFAPNLFFIYKLIVYRYPNIHVCLKDLKWFKKCF